MTNLDSQEEIKRIDSQNILESISSLPKQILHAWEEVNKVTLPDDYRDVNQLVMCGMGGSGLAARIIESVFKNELRIPLIRVNDYELPAFADSGTLVICSSYSGETEETLENARQAIGKGCKWIAVSKGNTLIRLAKEHLAPYYQISPVYNPSNQPRMAIGYSVVGQIALVSKASLIEISQKSIDTCTRVLNGMNEQLYIKNPLEKNTAKRLALRLLKKIVVFVSADHLVGAAHTVNNQLNENAKTLSFDFQIPELNHHLMEGLKYPPGNDKNLFAVFFDSDLYPEKIRKRLEITKEVFSKNNIEFFSFKPQSEDKLVQSFEVILFGSYVNFYLGMLYEQDPGPIPWVDYFKERLGQSLGK